MDVRAIALRSNLGLGFEILYALSENSIFADNLAEFMLNLEKISSS